MSCSIMNKTDFYKEMAEAGAWALEHYVYELAIKNGLDEEAADREADEDVAALLGLHIDDLIDMHEGFFEPYERYVAEKKGEW